MNNRYYLLLMFGQFSDTPLFRTICGQRSPNFSDIGQTRTDLFLKLAQLDVTLREAGKEGWTGPMRHISNGEECEAGRFGQLETNEQTVSQPPPQAVIT